MIVQCTCTSPKHYHHAIETAAAFQDRVYGFSNRVANLGGKTGAYRAVCTIYKVEHRVGGDEAIAQKKAK